MKRFGIFVLSSVFLLLYFSCVSNGVIDNTFVSTVQNDSDFSILIDGITITPKQSVKHRFPLHDSALYDGWSVDYSIPFLSNLTYTAREKLYITDEQTSVIIENPHEKSFDGCYVIVRNDSNNPIQITDETKSKIYPCYVEGVLNQPDVKTVYSIACGQSAVCRFESEKSKIYICESIEKSNKTILFSFPYKNGVVYNVRFDSNGIHLIDERAMQFLKEDLWTKNYPKNVLLRSVLQKDEKIFLLGTESLRDKKGNQYISSFLQCLCLDGKEIWKQEYGEKGADTYLYDMSFCGEEKLLVVGQGISENLCGIILMFDFNGKLIQSFPIKEAIGLDSIISLQDGSCIVNGYDKGGNEISFNVNERLSYIQRKSSFDKTKLDGFIQSMSSVLQYEKDEYFVAGERAGQERPSAVIVKLGQKGNVSVLYSAREPFSYITDMKFYRDKRQLVVVGTVNGEDSFGNCGTPFIRCIDAENGAVIWESFSNLRDFEVSVRFAPCENYGFVQILANSDSDGELTSPCALIRTNATGSQ